MGAHLPAAVVAGGDYRGRDGRPCHGEMESGAAVMMIVFIASVASPAAAPPPGNKEPPRGTQHPPNPLAPRLVTVRDRDTLARPCRPLITRI